jgi:hypothetical protein
MARRAFTSSSDRLSIRTLFSRAVSPRTIETARLGRPSDSARSSTTAVFAALSTGGAVTLK